MLNTIEYLFDAEDLHDAFAEVISRVAGELDTAATADLYSAVMLTICDDQDLIITKTEGRDDAIFVGDAEGAVDALNAILEAFGENHTLPRAAVLKGELGDGTWVPLLFLEGEFEVTPGEIHHTDLFCVSVENNAETGSYLRAVQRAGPPAASFDFWNLVLEPLGITDRIEESLEGAGIDPAGYDHDGGDTVDGREFTDFYYKLPAGEIDDSPPTDGKGPCDFWDQGFQCDKCPVTTCFASITYPGDLGSIDIAIHQVTVKLGGCWEYIDYKENTYYLHRVD